MNLQVSILRILKGGKAFVGLKVLLFNGARYSRFKSRFGLEFREVYWDYSPVLVVLIDEKILYFFTEKILVL